MDTHKGEPEPGKSSKESSGNISMILTAFGFMLLMLVVTAPAAGPGPAPVMDHNQGPVQNNGTNTATGPHNVLPLAGGTGPAPDPVMAWVRTITHL
jgi:hypothetical protein